MILNCSLTLKENYNKEIYLKNFHFHRIKGINDIDADMASIEGIGYGKANLLGKAVVADGMEHHSTLF